jgi:hypothetical protein
MVHQLWLDWGGGGPLTALYLKNYQVTKFHNRPNVSNMHVPTMQGGNCNIYSLHSLLQNSVKETL